MLFSSQRGGRPGPKGPAQEWIDAVVEMKRRNPTRGCPRIAQQITLAFGVDIDKDMTALVPSSKVTHTVTPTSARLQLDVVMFVANWWILWFLGLGYLNPISLTWVRRHTAAPRKRLWPYKRQFITRSPTAKRASEQRDVLAPSFRRFEARKRVRALLSRVFPLPLMPMKRR